MIFWGVIFALGAGLNIALGGQGWSAVLSGSLADPDSYMRLVRIEQSLAQGRLLNAVAGDQSGAGVLLEWSHLFDMLVIALAAPLAVAMGWKTALFAAGVAMGPLGTGLLGMALAYAARPFAEDRLLWTAAVAAALSPDLLNLAPPGAVHDAALTLAFVALSAGCVIRAWRGGTGHAFLGGVCGGLAVWLTPEILPLILAGFLPLLLRWLQKPTGAVVASCTAGFFDVIGFAFSIDPPKGGYFVADIHRLSLVYAVLAVLLLFAGTTIWRLQDWQRARLRRPAGIATVVAVLLIWAVFFPRALSGAAAMLLPNGANPPPGFDTLSHPVLGVRAAIQCLGAGILALIYAMWRAFAGRSWHFLYLAAVILAVIGLGARLALFAAVSGAIGAALLPVLLSELNQRFRAAPAAAALARFSALAAVVLLPYLPAFAKTPPSRLFAAAPPSPCSLRHINLLLRNDQNQIVLAIPNATPELLYRTKVKTVGSLYVNGLAGYQRAEAAWRSPPTSQESDAFRATGATLVLFCPLGARDPMLAGRPGGTLPDALQTGTIPPWLVLQAADPSSGWRLFATH